MTSKASQDALGILDWLLTENAGDAGQLWFQGMSHAIASLAEMPRRCKRVAQDEELTFELRELYYGRKPHVYRILFSIDGESVNVLRIRHGRRLSLAG